MFEFSLHAFCILLLFVDLVPADLGVKTDFLPLMVTLTVDLRHFFATKALIYAESLIVVLLALLGTWSWALSFLMGTHIWMCLGVLIAAYSFVWLTQGIYAAGLSWTPNSGQSMRCKIT